MRYYLDTQGPLKLFKSRQCKELLDLEYLRRKAPKIYLNIVYKYWNNSGIECIQVKLYIPNEEAITAFISPILFNIILIEDYEFDLIDGRFNQQCN